MRILAIRGQNLASLAERFEIDLTREPLAGTGLFAITGDTGAGKSTILDALCLGLYGAYPRAGSEGRERVFDPGNEEIQAGDARNILRRGAGEGFGEVDFVGQDGIEYRASWAVRRARGRATGRLQPVERRLDRLDGSANVASGIRDVDVAVTEKTGLTYDQFRRTVLLAQGEFDTFLLASETERADLLEKITGTGIYSRISKRVHAEKDERERRLKEREAISQGIETLSEEDRQALTAERDKKRGATQALDAAIRSLAQQRARADLVARTRENLTAAETALAEAEAHWHAGEGQRAQRASLMAVEPLRAKVDGQTRARNRLAEAEEGLRSSQEAELTAAENHERVEAAAKEAQERADEARAEVARFAPVWGEAARLDTRIATAAQELKTAEKAHADARETVAERQAAHDQQAKARDELIERRARTEAGLAARVAHEPLHTNRARIEELLSGHDHLSGQLAECTGQQEKTTREIEALQARHKASAEEIATTDEEIARLDAALSEKGAALTAMRLDEAEARDEALGGLERTLHRAHEAASKRDAALAEHEEAAASRDAAALAYAEAEEQLATHRQMHEDARLKREAIAQLVDLAEATASHHAEALRADLVAGEPCPVCGATSHPYAGTGSAANALVAEVRRQRADLDAALKSAQSGITAAESARATADAQHKAADKRVTQSTLRLDGAMADLARLLPEIAGLAGPAQIHLDAFTGTGGADAPVEVYASAIRDVEAARAATKALRQKAAALRKERDGLDERIKGLREKAKEAQARIREGETALAERRADLSGLAERRRSVDEQIRSTYATLAPFLSAAGVTDDDLTRDSRIAHARMKGLAEDYGKLLGARDQLTGEIDVVETALREAAMTLQAAKSDAERCARQSAERRTQVEDLETERAALLGGEPTDQHRARFESARQRAEQALGEAHDKLRAVQIERVQSGEAAKNALAKVEEARQEADDAVEALSAALVVLGLEERAARELLAVAPETRAALAQEVAALDHARSDARAAAETRRKDLAQLDAGEGEGSTEAIEVLRQDHDRLSGEKNALTERLAVVRATLEKDNETKERLAEALKEIEALKVDLGVWREVHDAIGSSDGAKFRRFAQGITLRHLVGLANRQLAALNPRYQLRQATTSALALDVIDRDMGEEVRSPRSLSGGERFLVSLALALALSSLEGRQSFVDTLFIDEGFGSLDRDTLDVAIDALESLQGQGRKVGLITHVQAMMERIAVQVRVEKRGGGRSVVRMRDATTDEADSRASLTAAARL